MRENAALIKTTLKALTSHTILTPLFVKHRKEVTISSLGPK